MTSQLTAYGLGLLWVGAMALGGLVMMRQKPLPPIPHATHNGPLNRGEDADPLAALRRQHVRRHTITLVCQFAGSGGIIAGLGLLAVGVIK